MKLNKILMVLAATAIVGCTSEDLNDFNAKQAPEDSRMIQLDENFVISGVGVDGAMTRTHWEWDDPATKKTLVNKFLPIYNTDGAINDILAEDVDLEANAVGLCWLGQTPGAEVYTNYQFYHFGWLNNDEPEADVDKCGTLYNGALYSDIKLKAATTDGNEAKPADWTAAGLPDKAKKAGADNLNYNSGVYKTDNKAIFAGDYIVYYPFNKDFDKAGTIPAKAVTEFNNIPANAQFNTAEIGEATFRYSGKVTINGGDQAAGFGMKNLSTLVQVRVATPKGVTIPGAMIDQVVLYSKNKKLLKQANLAADKIAAGQTGEALYADKEGTQTIIANFTAGGVDLKATNANPNSAYITVLPTTVDDLVVLVHRCDAGNDTWAQVAIGNTVFKAGNAQVLNATVTEDDFKTEFFAVDQTSLFAAIQAADDTHPTEANPATVTLIGDIELTGAALSIDETTYTYLKYINIEDGAIVIPEGVDLTLQGANVKSDIRVLGKGCCTAAAPGGRLIIDNGTVVNDVTMEPTEARINPNADPADPDSYETLNPMVTYTGALATVAEGAEFDVLGGTVVVGDGLSDVAVEHKAAINIAEGAKLIVNAKGDLQFMGTDVVNDGTIEVMKAGHFDITDADGNASWDDGKNMENNGTFIHNVDATVGTAVQAMQQKGEYRCRVDKQKALDDAYVQWTACSVIEMVDGATEYDLVKAQQHNSKFVDIEVNNGSGATKFTDPDATNGKAINIGNLTAMTELSVDYGTKSTLTVNGNMTVSANTELTKSKKIAVTKNLDINNGATLTYKAANAEGLAVTENITVTDATFNANTDGAVLIKCKNFSLIKENPAGAGSTATFGNRTASDSAKKTMEVGGTIKNDKGCTFTITPAAGANLLAWITCKKLEVGGAFPGGRPSVIE